jgi:hypothetical protein
MRRLDHIIIMAIPDGMLITPDVPEPGAGGTCAVRSAAIRVRRSIWLDHGRTMDRTQAVRPSVRSSSGVIMSEKLSVRRTVSGSFKVATTEAPSGAVRDHLPVLSRSEMHTQRIEQ